MACSDGDDFIAAEDGSFLMVCQSVLEDTLLGRRAVILASG